MPRPALALLAAAGLVAALAAGWRMLRGGDAPERVQVAHGPAVETTAPAAGVPDRAAPMPAGERRQAAQDVRPPDTVTQPFPQLHTSPRRSSKEGTRGEKRHAKPELYESKKDMLFDTAEPVEVPFEGDFPVRGTFSFWLNPVWDGSSQDDASFVTVADGRLRIVKNVGFLRYETVDANGNGDGLGYPIADWQPGEWHFITATWDGGLIGLYVDGAMVGQKYIEALDLPADSSVFVGSLFPPGRPIAPGMMSTFRFRGRVLEQGAVGREFANTMPAPVGEDGQ
jgi:hypothetical protein